MIHELDLRLWQARYREYLEIVRGWSPRTVENYTAELKVFFPFLERQGVTNLTRLTRAHLEGYRLELFHLRRRDRPLSKQTQACKLSAIKQFARYLFRSNYVLLDLSSGFDLPRVEQKVPRYVVTEKEALQLIDQPDIKTPLGIRDRAVLELFYGTGLRNSELRQLKMDQVDLERGLLRIDHGKGGKARVVPLGEEALVWLEEYLNEVRPQLLRSPEQQLVFPSPRTGGLMPRSTTSWIVSQVAKKAGIAKNVTPHVLRHACATHMLRRGANVRHLQVLLGHSSLDTTQIYTRVEVSDLAKVVRRCHPREQVEEL